MDAHLLFRMLRNKIDIILTSPPYLNAQTYSKDNWLRQWLLGYDHRALHTAYLETGSVPRYEAQMLTALSIMFRMLRPGGRLICVAGDVRLRNNTPGVYKTGRRLAELAALPAVGFNVEEEETHRVASLKRYYHALNDTNGHSSRDLIERVFVASKGVDL
jgi:DNA modification methylase